jgi:hypothetical protein
VPASPVDAQPSLLLQPATQVLVAGSQWCVGAQRSSEAVHSTHLPVAVSHAFPVVLAAQSLLVLHDVGAVSSAIVESVTDVSSLAPVSVAVTSARPLSVAAAGGSVLDEHAIVMWANAISKAIARMGVLKIRTAAAKRERPL